MRGTSLTAGPIGQPDRPRVVPADGAALGQHTHEELSRGGHTLVELTPSRFPGCRVLPVARRDLGPAAKHAGDAPRRGNEARSRACHGRQELSHPCQQQTASNEGRRHDHRAGGAAIDGLDLRIRRWALADEPDRLFGKVEVAHRISHARMGCHVAVRRGRQGLQLGLEHTARQARQLQGGGATLPGGDRRRDEVSASFAREEGWPLRVSTGQCRGAAGSPIALRSEIPSLCGEGEIELQDRLLDHSR